MTKSLCICFLISLNSTHPLKTRRLETGELLVTGPAVEVAVPSPPSARKSVKNGL